MSSASTAVASGRTTDSRNAARLGGRWWRRIRPGEKLVCPRGHVVEIDGRRLNGSLVHQCTKLQSDTHGRRGVRNGVPVSAEARQAEIPCGVWLYLLGVRDFGVVSVAVDWPEVQAVELCTTPDEVFTLLDVWPG